MASLDMLPDFGCSQLRSVGAPEGRGGGDIVEVALCLQCSKRDIVEHCVEPQQLQERHCDDRGDVGNIVIKSDDIVIKWCAS